MLRSRYLIPLFFACLALAPPAQAQPWQGRAGWERLGCVDTGRRPDFDVIQVGRREGRFSAIMLEVSGNSVHVDELRVIYANGEPDRIPVRSDIRANSTTRPLDLRGAERSIDRIEIVSRTDPRFRGRARICVIGQTAFRPGPPHGGGWDQLGCQQVGAIPDRDSIRVGRREGRFRAIRLEVHGNDVIVDNLTVIYSNGERDVIPMRGMIRQGTMSPPLDLHGNRRGIDRIDLTYRTPPNFRGTARVCASGLP